MQGIAGLGNKPIKVSIAVQKAKEPVQPPIEYPAGITQTIQKQLTGQYTTPQTPQSTDYSAYYNQYNSYWSNMAAWQQYNQYYQQFPTQDSSMAMNPPLPPDPSANGGDHGMGNGGVGDDGGGAMQSAYLDPSLQYYEEEEPSIFVGPSNQPVDHSKPLDYDRIDRKYFSRSAELYDSIEESRWRVTSA